MARDVIDLTGNLVKADAFDPGVVADAAKDVGLDPSVLEQDNVQDALEAVAAALDDKADDEFVYDDNDGTSVATVGEALQALMEEVFPVQGG